MRTGRTCAITNEDGERNMAIFKSSTQGEAQAKKPSDWAIKSTSPKNHPPIPWSGTGGNVKPGKHHKS